MLFYWAPWRGLRERCRFGAPFFLAERPVGEMQNPTRNPWVRQIECALWFVETFCCEETNHALS